MQPAARMHARTRVPTHTCMRACGGESPCPRRREHNAEADANDADADEGDDDDDEEGSQKWSLRKCSAAGLDRLSVRRG